MTMQYRSFEDWLKKGKVVKKGERASARTSEGLALFSSDQVKKITRGNTTPSEPTYQRMGFPGRYLDSSDYGFDSLDYDPYNY